MNHEQIERAASPFLNQPAAGSTFDHLKRSMENPRYKDVTLDIEGALIYV